MLNIATALFVLLPSMAAAVTGADILPPPPELQVGSTTYIEVTWTTERMWGWWGDFEDAPVSHQSRTTGWLQHVDSVAPDGGLRLTLTFDRQAGSLEYANRLDSFDSDVNDAGDSTNMLAPLLGPVVGRSITVEVDNARRVVKVEGMSEIWADISAGALDNEYLDTVESWLEADSVRHLIDQVLMLYPTGERRFGSRWRSTFEENGTRGDARFAYARLERRAGRMTVDVCYDFDVKQIDEYSDKTDDLTWTRLQFSGRGHGSATFDQERGNLVSAIEVGQDLMRSRYESPEYDEPDIVDTFDRYRQQTICLTPADRAAQKAQRKAKAVAGGK